MFDMRSSLMATPVASTAASAGSTQFYVLNFIYTFNVIDLESVGFPPLLRRNCRRVMLRIYFNISFPRFGNV
jgi:hypothetical protein